MQTASLSLLSNASASSAGTDLWPGGRGHFSVVATWGGGSVKLQYLGPDNTTWIDAQVLDSTGALTSVSSTANGGYVVDLPPGPVKAVVATATAVYACLSRVPA